MRSIQDKELTLQSQKRSMGRESCTARSRENQGCAKCVDNTKQGCELLVAPDCNPEKCWNHVEGMCKECYHKKIERSSNRLNNRSRENLPIYKWIDAEYHTRQAVEAKVKRDLDQVAEFKNILGQRSVSERQNSADALQSTNDSQTLMRLARATDLHLTVRETGTQAICPSEM